MEASALVPVRVFRETSKSCSLISQVGRILPSALLIFSRLLVVYLFVKYLINLTVAEGGSGLPRTPRIQGGTVDRLEACGRGTDSPFRIGWCVVLFKRVRGAPTQSLPAWKVLIKHTNS